MLIQLCVRTTNDTKLNRLELFVLWHVNNKSTESMPKMCTIYIQQIIINVSNIAKYLFIVFKGLDMLVQSGTFLC